MQQSSTRVNIFVFLGLSIFFSGTFVTLQTHVSNSVAGEVRTIDAHRASGHTRTHGIDESRYSLLCINAHGFIVAYAHPRPRCISNVNAYVICAPAKSLHLAQCGEPVHRCIILIPPGINKPESTHYRTCCTRPLYTRSIRV